MKDTGFKVYNHIEIVFGNWNIRIEEINDNLYELYIDEFMGDNSNLFVKFKNADGFKSYPFDTISDVVKMLEGGVIKGREAK